MNLLQPPGLPFPLTLRYVASFATLGRTRTVRPVQFSPRGSRIPGSDPGRPATLRGRQSLDPFGALSQKVLSRQPGSGLLRRFFQDHRKPRSPLNFRYYFSNFNTTNWEQKRLLKTVPVLKPRFRKQLRWVPCDLRSSLFERDTRRKQYWF